MSVRILCAIDDQEPSRKAASVAVDLAKGLSAELILCMINPAVLPGRGPITYLWTDKYMDHVLNDVMRSARLEGLWDIRLKKAKAMFVADAVLDFADEFRADYIVVGASDRSALMKVLSGSVSRKISSKASCPVLIVRRIRGEQDSAKNHILDRMLSLLCSAIKRHDGHGKCLAERPEGLIYWA
jgi:nucleotide-binding universal stress UspA family protein